MYADAQWTLPENAKPKEKSWADEGYTWQTRIWIDDMFMITAVQSQAYRATGDKKYISRAAKEMVLYLDTIHWKTGCSTILLKLNLAGHAAMDGWLWHGRNSARFAEKRPT